MRSAWKVVSNRSRRCPTRCTDPVWTKQKRNSGTRRATAAHTAPAHHSIECASPHADQLSPHAIAAEWCAPAEAVRTGASTRLVYGCNEPHTCGRTSYGSKLLIHSMKCTTVQFNCQTHTHGSFCRGGGGGGGGRRFRRAGRKAEVYNCAVMAQRRTPALLHATRGRHHTCIAHTCIVPASPAPASSSVMRNSRSNGAAPPHRVSPQVTLHAGHTSNLRRRTASARHLTSNTCIAHTCIVQNQHGSIAHTCIAQQHRPTPGIR